MLKLCSRAYEYLNKSMSYFCRNQTSIVNLQLLRTGKKVEQVVYGREYTLRADITHPDGNLSHSSLPETSKGQLVRDPISR